MVQTRVTGGGGRQSGTVIDLNSQLPKKSGWSLLEIAYGINDAGQIVGEGQVAGSRHAFLLTPTIRRTAAALASTSPPIANHESAGWLRGEWRAHEWIHLGRPSKLGENSTRLPNPLGFMARDRVFAALAHCRRLEAGLER
jgi:probable HAF family extracellular repeat protein